MDMLFFRLGQFSNYIESRLVAKDDVARYLKYWIDIIVSPETEDLRIAFSNYLILYRYDPLVNLAVYFGYSEYRENALKDARKEITELFFKRVRENSKIDLKDQILTLKDGSVNENRITIKQDELKEEILNCLKDPSIYDTCEKKAFIQLIDKKTFEEFEMLRSKRNSA